MSRRDCLFQRENSLFFSVGNFGVEGPIARGFLGLSRLEKGRNFGNSLFFSLISGNLAVETGSTETASTASLLRAAA
jgi:hypothetical protein